MPPTKIKINKNIKSFLMIFAVMLLFGGIYFGLTYGLFSYGVSGGSIFGTNEEEVMPNDFLNKQTSAVVKDIRTPQQMKKICEDAFSGKDSGYNEDDPLLPISCVREIGETELPATFTISSSGEFKITRDTTVLFDAGSAGGYDFLNEKDAPGSYYRMGSIYVDDFTYDGNDDLAIRYHCGADTCVTKIFSYDPIFNTYNKTPLIEGDNWVFDEQHKTIEFVNEGKSPYSYTQKIYHFENGGYVPIKRETLSAIDDNNPSKGYIRTNEEMKGGKMVVIKKVTLTEQEVISQETGD